MSSKTTSIAPGDRFREFAARKVSEGRYGRFRFRRLFGG
ncbi:hypothetical protein V473_13870 [Sphingobium cupriresistens LL01]|uniref:Uncharacterized protein n=1 Tax=Sphingobium cupriresistens LL01 TaxID=1420583 RepID=A0A0J7XWI2_9SPHN|nr:hypothetical protein V473_13870 [Sphingobium cupriresistens LL01]